MARAKRSLGLVVPLVGALALAGCPDDPHFDAEGYEIVTGSIVLRDYAGAVALAQGENWLYPFANYEPQFCSSRTTTVGAGDRDVTLDWHGCNVAFSDLVGVLEYAGGGAYEGLVDVTVNLSGQPATFGVLVRFEPREVE